MAGPPLWVIEGCGATVYLFGDAVGAGDDRWLTESVRRSLAVSACYWREFPDFDELAASAVVMSSGLSSDPLANRLDPGDQRRLEDACDRLAVDPEGLQALRPWLAAQLIDQAHQVQMDIDPSWGVESVLTRMAREQNKVERFEFDDAEAAVDLFANLGDDAEVEYLRWTIERASQSWEDLDAQVNAWLTSDFESAEHSSTHFKASYPNLYGRLVIERNHSWIPRFTEMLTDEQDSFVLVGFGHLLTEDGIPALLAASGHSLQLVA